MIRTSGNVVIPVVSWASTPPDHEIMSLLLSEDGEDLVTGAADGNIVLWRINAKYECKPQWMLNGHRTAVINLCLASVSPNRRPLFFSHSASGEMAVWNWYAAKCLEFKYDNRYKHTTIRSHQPTFLDYRLLFCCGHYAHIIVLHATSLAVLFTLASQSHPDWVSSFVVLTHPNRKNEIVLGLSFSNVVTLWTLDGEELQGETKYEHESKSISCPSTVFQVDCCPQTPRCLLLINAFGWQLLNAVTCSIHCTVDHPKKDPLIGGEFVESNMVAVYGRSGTVYLYRICKSLINSKTVSSIQPPTQIGQLSFVNHSMHSMISNICSERGYCCFSQFRSSSKDVGDADNTSTKSFIAGTVDGQLVCWNWTNGLSNCDNSNIHYPVTVSDLRQTWARHTPKNMLNLLLGPSVDSTTETIVSVDYPSLSITVCIQLTEMHLTGPNNLSTIHPAKLAFGLSDGRIVLVHFVDFMETMHRPHFAPPPSSSLSQLSSFFLTGHRGPVTSLLHPASAERNSQPLGADHTDVLQMNPDYLISGGADFTVRLWILDPCHETKGAFVVPRHQIQQCGAVCLAVFRYHAAPCIGLSIGPPAAALLNQIAGNTKLLSCICSFGADGSVCVINLTDLQCLLYAANTHGVSLTPVLAIGWRIPEDLLLIMHLDGTLAVWDISMSCLDRLEMEQSAKDLFEQAQFITEVYQLPAQMMSSSLSNTLYYNSLLQSYGRTRSGSVANSQLVCSYNGYLNCPPAAGSVRHTVPSRLKCIVDLHKLGLHYQSTNQCSPTAPVQLQLIGSTKNGALCNTMSDQLKCGPAAFVFHWDTQTLIVELLSQSTHPKDSHTVPNYENATSALKAKLQLLKILLSIIHPWGLNKRADLDVLACCNMTNALDDDADADNSSDSQAVISDITSISFDNPMCIGLVSKGGCVSLSMPGYVSRLKSTTTATQPDVTSLPTIYHLSSIVNTNLILCGFSLLETITSMNSIGFDNSLIGDIVFKCTHKSPVNGRHGDDDHERFRWYRLAALWLDHFLPILLPKSDLFNVSVRKYDQCYLELPIFAKKWQDRCLPIRYAARTLLFGCLDHLGDLNRNRLVCCWSSLLPPFALPKEQNNANCASPSAITDPTCATTANPTTDLSLVSNIEQFNCSDNILRKQSLPSHDIIDRRLSTCADSSIHHLKNGAGDSSISTDSRHPYKQFMKHRSLSGTINQVDVTNTIELNNYTGSGITSTTQTNSKTSTSINLTESISLTSLSNGDQNLQFVIDSPWWLSLKGYRVSAQKHARLQAVSIIMLGVIGTRFGQNFRRRHPAIAARDLITCLHDPHSCSGHFGTDDHNMTKRYVGLAEACFASPDSTVVMENKSPRRPSSIQSFMLECSPHDVQDGFGFKNYHLARSVCQCLTSLLSSQATMLSPSHPDIDWSKINTHCVNPDNPSTVSTMAANVLISLLTTNKNSSLRRAAIDILGRGFCVWEPYVEVSQVINALLTLAADMENLSANLQPWQPISDRHDLARSAREAIWSIAFARPKLVTLTLSLEVRRYGAQINAAATAISPANAHSTQITAPPPHHTMSYKDGEFNQNACINRRGSLVQTDTQSSPIPLTTAKMTVMMASPTVVTPVFATHPSSAGHKNGSSPDLTNTPCPPLFKAREEILHLFEQLCIRRPSDVKDVLPELVEVILSCLDRTKLKERGLDFVFPALKSFHALSSHTRLQKVCAGGVNGSLTFYDFKVGRYFVTMAHKGPVTAVCFHSDGRQVATYSITESILRIWQLHTTGFFGMGGQQVKQLAMYPVPPLIPPPPPIKSQDPINSIENQAFMNQLQVWVEWPESKVLYLLTNTGIKRRVAL